jgi:hypothetical protein
MMKEEGKETATSLLSNNKDDDIETTEAITVGPYQPPKASPGILSRPSNEIGFPYTMKCPYCSSKDSYDDDKMITVVTKDVDGFRIAAMLSVVAFTVWLIKNDAFSVVFVYFFGLAICWLPPRIYQHNCENCSRPVAKEYHWIH